MTKSTSSFNFLLNLFRSAFFLLLVFLFGLLPNSKNTDKQTHKTDMNNQTHSDNDTIKAVTQTETDKHLHSRRMRDTDTNTDRHTDEDRLKPVTYRDLLKNTHSQSHRNTEKVSD